MPQKLATRNVITLKGSAQIVAQYFDTAVNSILFQRAVYPDSTFEDRQVYGLTLKMTTDEQLKKYLKDVLSQMRDWLESGHLKRLVVVVSDAYTKQATERWSFDIVTDTDITGGTGAAAEKQEAEILKGLRHVLRQVLAVNVLLPAPSEASTFDLLMYTSNDSEVPVNWELSDPRFIEKGCKMMALGHIDTKIHKVATSVAYQDLEADDMESSDVSEAVTMPANTAANENQAPARGTAKAAG